MVDLRKEATNIIHQVNGPSVVLFELILEVESAPGGSWTTGDVLATTKFGFELGAANFEVPRFSWTPHSTYVVPPLGGLSGNVRLAIVATAVGSVLFEEFPDLDLAPHTIRGEIVVM